MSGGEEVVVLPPLLHLHLPARAALRHPHQARPGLPLPGQSQTATLFTGLETWYCFKILTLFCFILLSKLSPTTDDSYDQSDADPMSDEEKQRLKEEAKKLRLSGQNPDEVPEGDFLSEAKVK